MIGSAIPGGIARLTKRFISYSEPVSRPLAMFVAGRIGGGITVQFGPRAVKAVVDYTVTGYFAKQLCCLTANAFFGPYYYPAGQVIFSGLAAVSPGPVAIADKITPYFYHQRYLAELDKSDFDPTRLEAEDVELEGVEEGYVNYTYEPLPVDESTYCFFNKEDAEGMPPLLPLNGKPEFEMEVFKTVETDASEDDNAAL
ncbi:hypothetical protein ACTL6P_05760 [Endozoicomonas acroporae]|uniref:hypothetical protein n=1 Tax=Endozoicomonas acroporae TaxID=1701104 RepID=UPI000C76B4AC|nr:hypothetical protein [Endozoicomonas acroporae]